MHTQHGFLVEVKVTMQQKGALLNFGSLLKAVVET